MMTTETVKILFLCTGNSCRSQMAEGFARHLKFEQIEAWSAGVERHGINEHAIRVMAEKGVDISHHSSKLLTDIDATDFDYVITVCGHAHESCPVFPGRCTIVHVGFDDPPKLANTYTDEKLQLDCYRRVRDEIEHYIMTLPDSLPGYEEDKR